jgi:hypothetical protein
MFIAREKFELDIANDNIARKVWKNYAATR